MYIGSDFMDSVNKQCLEKVLIHIAKLIQLSEFENIKDLCKLIDKANEVSAQLLAVDEIIYKESEE